MFKSRFSIVQVYITMGIFLAFFAGSIYLFVHPELKAETKSGAQLPIIVIAVAMLLLALYGLLSLQKWLVQITIWPERIVLKGILNERSLIIEEIVSMDLVARRSVGVLSRNLKVDVTLIELITGEEITLPDLIYSNAAGIKKTLADTFPELVLQQKIPVGNRQNYKPIYSGSEKFAGNPFTSYNGLYIAVSLVVSFIFFLKKPVPLYILPSLSFFLVTYFCLFWQMNYFIIYGDDLVIKSHLAPWKMKTIPLSDIEECVLETRAKRSNTLRVIQKNFQNNAFAAGSLRKDDWKKLDEALTARNIVTLNEINS